MRIHQWSAEGAFRAGREAQRLYDCQNLAHCTAVQVAASERVALVIARPVLEGLGLTAQNPEVANFVKIRVKSRNTAH